MNKVSGLVIKEVRLKENDKIVTIFSKKYGKVTLYARGAQKIKSPLFAGTQVLSYCNFEINGKSDIKYINKLEIIKSYHKIRNDINTLYYSLYFIEFINKTIVENDMFDELFDLTLITFYNLEKRIEEVRLIRIIFELKAMCILGYTPNVKGCSVCGNEDIMYFNIKNGNGVCDRCKVREYNKITNTALYTIRYIINSNISDVFRFRIDDVIIIELQKILTKFISYNLDYEFKTLTFI